jgi:hypothetical protein
MGHLSDTLHFLEHASGDLILPDHGLLLRPRRVCAFLAL